MTREELEDKVTAGKYDYEYADFLMNHTDARIYNGDRLLEVMESCDYFDSFCDWLENRS